MLLSVVTPGSKILIIINVPGDSDSKESTCNAGELGSIPGLGRSPGEGNGQKSLVGYSLWGLKESGKAERRPRHFTYL